MKANVYFEDRGKRGYWKDKVWQPHPIFCFTCAVQSVNEGNKIIMQAQEGQESYMTCDSCGNTIEDEISL